MLKEQSVTNKTLRPQSDNEHFASYQQSLYEAKLNLSYFETLFFLLETLITSRFSAFLSTSTIEITLDIFAMMIEVMTRYGADSFQGKLASVIQGTTETTFYVLAVYFGSVNIKNTRYALTAGLIADFFGLLAAILLAYLFFH